LKLLNIKLVSLREGIDSFTPTGTLMMSLFATLYEFEKNTIKERTQRALASKRARGLIGGRPKVHSKIVQRALLDYQNNMPIKDILLQNKISRTTLYRYLNMKHNIKDQDKDNRKHI
jgi:DNA invertase Pin-like site-specific DNA recombinase